MARSLSQIDHVAEPELSASGLVGVARLLPTPPDIDQRNRVEGVAASPRTLEPRALRVVGASRPLLIALCAGMLLALAWPPVSWPYAAPAAIALLSLVIERSAGVRAAGSGLLFGLGCLGSTLWWLTTSIAPEAWLALSVVQALWFAPLGWALSVVRRYPLWPLWSAACWVTVELLRGAWPFGGFPWARLGTIVTDTPWSSLLPLVSTSGTGLMIAMVGFGLSALVGVVRSGRRISPKLLLAVAGSALLGVLPMAYDARDASTGSLTVAAVQGGVPGDGTDVAGHHRQVTGNILRVTRELARGVDGGRVPEPDLVVWPESSTAVDPWADQTTNQAIERAVAGLGRPLLMGAIVDAADPDEVLNQGILLDPSAGPTQRYTKRHPVPFGEYIPFRPLLKSLSPRLAQIPRDTISGEPSPPLDVAGTKTALAICFDVAFDDVIPDQVRAGAELVVVQTSNAMFMGTSQPEQQFAISRTRALEAGRSVVVASMNGVSGVIGPDGAVVSEVSTRGAAVQIVEVPLADEMTPAMRWGPRLDNVIVGIALAPVLPMLVHRLNLRRRRALA